MPDKGHFLADLFANAVVHQMKANSSPKVNVEKVIAEEISKGRSMSKEAYAKAHIKSHYSDVKAAHQSFSLFQAFIGLLGSSEKQIKSTDDGSFLGGGNGNFSEQSGDSGSSSGSDYSDAYFSGASDGIDG